MKKRKGLDIDEDLWNAARSIAVKFGISMSEYVEIILKKEVSTDGRSSAKEAMKARQQKTVNN